MAEPPKMTDEQKAKEEKRKEGAFTGLAGSRNGDANLRYARSAIVATINAAAFSFLGFQMANPIPALYLVLGIMGLLSCAFWFIINRKAQARIDYWHMCLAKLEPPETEASEFRIFTGEEWRKLNRWPNFQVLFNLLPITFAILWLGVLFMPPVIEKKLVEEKTPLVIFQFNSKTLNQHNSLKGDAP